jgi:DNA-directed RNA polymerase specialized sigma24 family protein
VEPLARRYRRLLIAYPDSYRRQRGEELLGTLLDTARPGQRRPTLAEAADLMLGGLRQRLGGSLAADLEAGLAFAAPFALALAAGLSGFLLLTVERMPAGIHGVGPFRTAGPAAYALWLAAAALRGVLPAGVSRMPVAAAMSVTVVLIPAAVVSGYQRPPLWVILALLGFGVIAMAGGGEPLTGAARLAVPVGALVAAALAKALLNWQQLDGMWWDTYYQIAPRLAGMVAAAAVLGVAAAGAVAAARGRPARPYLWAALLLALPGGWLGPMNTSPAGQFQPGIEFGRLAEVVLASCLILAAMTWLAALHRGARVGLLDRAGGLAIGCAGGLSAFQGLAGRLLFADRDWQFGDWRGYVGWVLVAAAWPFLVPAARRATTVVALVLMFLAIAPPPGVRGSLTVLAAVALVAPGRPATRIGGWLAVPLTALVTAGAAAVIGVYDNGWELTGWVAYQQTAALVMTVAIVPLTVAMVAGVRAVLSGTRTVAGALLVLAGAGWIGLLALPNLSRWGPTLLLLPLALGAVLVVQWVRQRPMRVARLRAYAEAHQNDLQSLAYLLTGDRATAGNLVLEALAGAYRSGRVEDHEVRRRLVRQALSRRTIPSTVDDPLWTAVYRLDPARRVALVLRLHAGMEPAQIAELMRRPEPAVRRLTDSALAELAGRGAPAK